MTRSTRRRAGRRERDGWLEGTARVDKRTKNLLARLQPGDIAVIDHEDIDRLSAEGLVQRKVAAVVNASRSSTGRYPNLGPLLLSSAGIHLVDDVGKEIMKLPEGERVVVEGDRVLRSNGRGVEEIGRGRLVDVERAEEILDAAKKKIAVQLEQFAENTMGYIRHERDVLLEAARLPDIRTDLHGRHVLIVVRGYDYKEDLAALRPYVREVRPVLVGVDGGADALLEFGLRPDLIIGDMDSVTNEALLSGAELVVHAYPGGEAPGLARIQALGLPCVLFEAAGTSEDVAMLLAHERGAEVIVAVGSHSNLVDFLDKGRKGMASTFLTRLRVGPILVDAKGVSRLYRARVRRSDLAMLVAAAVATMAIAVALSGAWRLDLEAIRIQLVNLWFAIRQVLFG